MNPFNRDLPNKFFPRLSVLREFAFCIIASIGMAFALPANAQTGHPASESVAQARRQAAEPVPPSERDVADTQEQMLKLLRLSPVLTTVVARDPSLLSDQQYVTRNNPMELAQFTMSHPDIAKNPEFYLFSHLDQGRGHREQVLERAIWPDLTPSPDAYRPQPSVEVMQKIVPIIGLLGFFFGLFWLINLFLQSRRWSRSFKLQSEVHSRLIDKFTSTQELAAYMETEAGKRFLEASPAALGTDMGVRMPNVVARVLTLRCRYESACSPSWERDCSACVTRAPTWKFPWRCSECSYSCPESGLSSPQGPLGLWPTVSG